MQAYNAKKIFEEIGSQEIVRAVGNCYYDIYNNLSYYILDKYFECYSSNPKVRDRSYERDREHAKKIAVECFYYAIHDSSIKGVDGIVLDIIKTSGMVFYDTCISTFDYHNEILKWGKYHVINRLFSSNFKDYSSYRKFCDKIKEMDDKKFEKVLKCLSDFYKYFAVDKDTANINELNQLIKSTKDDLWISHDGENICLGKIEDDTHGYYQGANHHSEMKSAYTEIYNKLIEVLKSKMTIEELISFLRQGKCNDLHLREVNHRRSNGPVISSSFHTTYYTSFMVKLNNNDEYGPFEVCTSSYYYSGGW
jgi:hypothetical protein